MEFLELTLEEYKQLKTPADNFLQSVEMYQRYQTQRREARLVGVKCDDEVVAAGVMVAKEWKFGKKIWRMPGGWRMNYARPDYVEVMRVMTRGMRKYARRHGGVVVMISPNTEEKLIAEELKHLHYKMLGEYEQVKWYYYLDIAGKIKEELFAGFRQNHRNLIRRAERDGVRVRELKNSEVGILKSFTAEAGEKHHFADPDEEYYRSMKEAFRDKVKLMVAEIPGKLAGEEAEWIPVAGAMFVEDAGEMVYLYSGSSQKYARYNGSYALQWAMIQKAVEDGCGRYNMYGVRPIEGDGVYRFKQGFRGKVGELVGTFALPIGILGRLYTLRIRPREYGEVR